VVKLPRPLTFKHVAYRLQPLIEVRRFPMGRYIGILAVYLVKNEPGGIIVLLEEVETHYTGLVDTALGVGDRRSFEGVYELGFDVNVNQKKNEHDR
jgi:hypothetical protein